MHEGELRELQKDNNTVIVSNAQYDWQQDRTKGLWPWDQVPIKKEKIAEESIKPRESNNLVKKLFSSIFK
jgi:hypothetical protein